MTDNWIDVTLPLHAGLPVWPGSSGMALIARSDMAAGDPVNVSELRLELHTGTHVDAPRHFLADGETVEAISLASLVGPAVVAYLPAATAVTAAELIALDLPPGTRRLLLRTRNSELWAGGDDRFREDFVALTADAAEWIVARGLDLVGVDYLSVQRFHDGPETHQILLGAGVVIVEGLDLSRVAPGQYELVCLPLPLVGAEGAPARVLIRPIIA